jgi:hypothetical protein
MRQIILALSFGLAATTYGQTDIYTPYRNQDLWSADTLFVGAGFARMDYKPVKIWLVGNEAGFEGQLFYIDPKTGNEIFLFGNHEDPGRVVTLTDIIDVPLGENLTFVYKVVNKGKAWKDIDQGGIRTPKYTGPNRPGSRYFSKASSNDNNNPSFRYGHRWSVAGHLGRKDLLEFGFEDDTTVDSDMDFDDIVFGVDGLTLVNFQRTAKVRSYIW